jgi:hypothetical protein
MDRLFTLLLFTSLLTSPLVFADDLSKSLSTLSAGTKLTLKVPYDIKANCEGCNAFGTEGCTFYPPKVLNYETQIPANDTLVVSQSQQMEPSDYDEDRPRRFYPIRVTFQSGAYLDCPEYSTLTPDFQKPPYDFTIKQFVDGVSDNITVKFPKSVPVNY